MARKKTDNSVVNDTDDLISSLISGSQFKFIGTDGEEGKGSITDKPKVETPIHALNCLLGGGLPLGSIIEVFGPNSSGKSSIMYETLGNFQRQYPNGVAFIIDTETSTDDARLRQLGVDPLRAPRMGATTLEDGFEQINFIMKKMVDDPRYKGFPVLILWDTIAAAPTRAQLAAGSMNAGGMAERARITKTALMTIFPLIEKQNVLLVLLNQVVSEIGAWKPGLTSGGGNALKHDIHIRLNVEGGKTVYDGVYATEKYSKVSVEKSKVSPIMNDFHAIIDITKGGVVDRAGSLLWWMTEVTPTVFTSGQYWKVTDDMYQAYKPYWDKFTELWTGSGELKFRQAKLYEVARADENFVDFLQLMWLDMISARYELQREVCKAMRSSVETRLMVNLGVTYEELNPEVESGTDEVSPEDLNSLVDALGGNADIDTSTGEVTVSE